MDSLLALLILASLVLLIIGFFNPQKSLFWYTHKRTGTKSALIYGSALVAFFILFGITSDRNESQVNSPLSDKSQVTTIAEPKDETGESKWTTVYSFKGNGTKKSPPFELEGGEARLKYTYSSESGLDIGMFTVYVVDEGVDIMEEGGFPEIMTSEQNERSESSIQKNAGRYYLNINAMGKWTVTVEELR